MTRRHATWIVHAAQPSYSALFLKIGDFLEKRHTLLRTLTDVATRPWRTPRLRAAYPEPPCTREYVKDHVPQGDSFGTTPLYQKSTRGGRRKLGVQSLPRNGLATLVSRCKLPYGGTNAVFGFFPIERNQHLRHGHRLGIYEIGHAAHGQCRIRRWILLAIPGKDINE